MVTMISLTTIYMSIGLILASYVYTNDDIDMMTFIFMVFAWPLLVYTVACYLVIFSVVKMKHIVLI